MVREADGPAVGLVKRTTPGLVRRLGGPLPVSLVTGGVALALAPEAIHLVSAMGVTADEAGLGLAAGVAAAALIEGGFRTNLGPTPRTAFAIASAAAAGVASGPLIHAVAPAFSGAWEDGVSAGAGLGLAAATLLGNFLYSKTAAGDGDAAAHVNNLSRMAVIPVAVAGAGIVASAIIAALGGHGSDVDGIHAITAVATGASAAPFVLGRLHARSIPKPRPALTE